MNFRNMAEAFVEADTTSVSFIANGVGVVDTFWISVAPYLVVTEVVRSSSGSSYFHFIWSIQGHLLPEESQEGILVVNFASRKLGFWSRIMASLMMRWRTFFIQHTTSTTSKTQPTYSSNSLQKLVTREEEAFFFWGSSLLFFPFHWFGWHLLLLLLQRRIWN